MAATFRAGRLSSARAPAFVEKHTRGTSAGMNWPVIGGRLQHCSISSTRDGFQTGKTERAAAKPALLLAQSLQPVF